MDLIGRYLSELGIPDLRNEGGHSHRQPPIVSIRTCCGNRSLRSLEKDLELEEPGFMNTDQAPIVSLFDDPRRLTA